MAIMPSQAPQSAQAPQAASASQSGPTPSQGQPPDPGQVLIDHITATDQAISDIAQVIGKELPPAGQALMKVRQEFQNVITSAIDQLSKGSSASQGMPMQASGKRGMGMVQEAPANMGGSSNARPAM